MQGTLAREHVLTQDTLALSTWACKARWHVSTQDTMAREHARHVGMWARKHARHVGMWARLARWQVSTWYMQFSKLVCFLLSQEIRESYLWKFSTSRKCIILSSYCMFWYLEFFFIFLLFFLYFYSFSILQ